MAEQKNYVEQESRDLAKAVDQAVAKRLDASATAKEEGSAKTSINEVIGVRLDNQFYRRILYVFGATVLLVMMLLHAKYLWSVINYTISILKPFIIGAALAFVIKIPMGLIEKLLHKVFPKLGFMAKRGISMFFSIVLCLALAVAVVTLVVPLLVQSVLGLKQQLPHFLHQVSQFLQRYDALAEYGKQLDQTFKSFSWDTVFQSVWQFLQTGYTQVFNSVVHTASTIFTGVFNAVIAFMFMIYCLLAKERLTVQGKQLSYAFLKEKQADRLLYVSHLLHDNFQGFIRGQLIDALALGVMTFICMLIFGIPYASMISVIIIITDLVPIVGPLVGVLASTLLIMIESPIKALIFFVLILLLQQIEANIIYPKVVGSAVGLPAMWTLVAISVGGSLGGIVGMWLSVPIFAVIYTVLSDYSRQQLKQKHIAIASKETVKVAKTVKWRDFGIRIKRNR